jgi:flavin reductase (DIM6/NTAB) family NADH-FMN oxidoreductase RutF
MQRMNLDSILQPLIKQIKAGVFLIAQAGDDLNVMTIGWASFGFIWGKPIMTIAVRPTRHTYGIIERSKDYSVSIPNGNMSKEIELCGTLSGKNCDKLKKSGLELFPALKVRSPILAVAGTHLECKIVYKAPIDPNMLIDEYKPLYPRKDYHTLYFGEIMECYSTADEITPSGRL